MRTRSHTISRRRAHVKTSAAARRLYRVSQDRVVAGRGVVATTALRRGTEVMRLRVKTYTDAQLAVRPTADVVPNDHCAVFCKETALWFVIAEHYGAPHPSPPARSRSRWPRPALAVPHRCRSLARRSLCRTTAPRLCCC